jgi:hypothetical protein
MNETELNETSEFDFVILANYHGPHAEMEARAVESVLRAAGIESVVEGAVGFASVPFEVSVARNQFEAAQKVLAEALAAGPAAAEQAEAELEGRGNGGDAE